MKGCQVGGRDRKCVILVRGYSSEYKRNACKSYRNPKGKMGKVRRGKTKRLKACEVMLKFKFPDKCKLKQWYHFIPTNLPKM